MAASKPTLARVPREPGGFMSVGKQRGGIVAMAIVLVLLLVSPASVTDLSPEGYDALIEELQLARSRLHGPHLRAIRASNLAGSYLSVAVSNIGLAILELESERDEQRGRRSR
jgi:hypothetical protein